jgi:LacI family transcriptional regulator
MPNFRDVPPIEPVRHIVRNRMADGIIFSRTEPRDERVKLLMEANFPFISHGRTAWSTHPFVDFDNDAFAFAAASSLIGKGRKRLLLIPADKRFTFAAHLEAGFMRAVREGGTAHEIPRQIHLDSTANEIRDYLTSRMGEPNPPDGFICSGDASTLATMAALYDTGHSIGVDVDVFAKHASRLFGLVRPRVDAIHEDIDLAGQQMAELLIRRIAGEPPAALQVLQKPAA